MSKLGQRKFINKDTTSRKGYGNTVFHHLHFSRLHSKLVFLTLAFKTCISYACNCNRILSVAYLWLMIIGENWDKECLEHSDRNSQSSKVLVRELSLISFDEYSTLFFIRTSKF